MSRGGMKKAKGQQDSNSIDKISELPQGILQRILYFLSQRQAARTSVLSKSWRYTWCTRPNLDFSDTFFIGKKQNYLSVVDKTLQRYCEQGLRVDEFYLCISLLGNDYSDLDPVRLLEKWISLFTNMCVKDFRLFIYWDKIPGRIDMPTTIFNAESLKILHLRRCMFVAEKSTPVKIAFERLQELRLEKVFFEEEIFDKIISSCPLLADMFLQDCKGLKTIKLDKKLHKYLKHFTFINREAHRTDECSIEIDLPTLETINIVANKIRILFHCHEFINLKILSLKQLRSYDDLVEHYHDQLSCIHAPNLLHFEHVGNFIPSLSFKPTLRASNVQVHIRGVEDARSWFVKLSELLKALSRSKISLNITQCTWTIMHIQDDVLLRDVIIGGNKPVVVENLELNSVRVSSLPSFFSGLFRIFRPRKITQLWLMEGFLTKEREQKEFIVYFSNMRERENYQKIWHDLEDLSIEGFYQSRQQWRPLPLQGTTFLENKLLDTISICIRLKWSEASESSSKLLE